MHLYGAFCRPFPVTEHVKGHSRAGRRPKLIEERLKIMNVDGLPFKNRECSCPRTTLERVLHVQAEAVSDTNRKLKKNLALNCRRDMRRFYFTPSSGRGTPPADPASKSER